MTCYTCNGDGETHHQSTRPDWDITETCRTCNGTGDLPPVSCEE